MIKKTHPMTAKLLQDLKNTNMNESSHKAAPTALPKAPPQMSQKLSITLYKTDIKKIDAIYSLAASNGKRVSTSDVVKLALRSMAVSPNLLKTLDAIRAEDGRTTKS
jgi:trans-2-enoyl-CoA reductase